MIARKRDGHSLDPAVLTDFVARYLDGTVGEEQMAAFLMAGVLRGFDDQEAVALTSALLASGQTVDLSMIDGPTFDKHSTGGVGDSTSLIVGPVLAACGGKVAKLSGRGLGHTGGTLDKLEAIPGFRTDLAPAEFRRQTQQVGLAVAAATADLVPADKRLYALRDVTATVESVALIASSIMSKKLAGGAQFIVLDVKTGSGAFLPQVDQARALAQLCVRLAESHGRSSVALLTDMSQPLSANVGNALEVRAAVDVLRGERDTPLSEVSLALAAEALALSGRADAYDEVQRALESGAALEVFREFVRSQGGDPSVAEDPRSVLPAAPVVKDWKSLEGVLHRVDCRGVGELARDLGAGRLALGDDVDPAVGLEFHARIGDRVGTEPTVTVHARTQEGADRAFARLPSLLQVGPDPVAPTPLIIERIGR